MKQSEEERHALTLSTTLSWLRGFAACKGGENDMPPMYALESAHAYFERRVNGEYDEVQDDPSDNDMIASMGAKGEWMVKSLSTIAKARRELAKSDKPKRHVSPATKLKLSRAATARWAKKNAAQKGKRNGR